MPHACRGYDIIQGQFPKISSAENFSVSIFLEQSAHKNCYHWFLMLYLTLDEAVSKFILSSEV